MYASWSLHGHTTCSQTRQQPKIRVPIQSMKKSGNLTKGGVLRSLIEGPSYTLGISDRRTPPPFVKDLAKHNKVGFRLGFLVGQVGFLVRILLGQVGILVGILLCWVWQDIYLPTVFDMMTGGGREN